MYEAGHSKTLSLLAVLCDGTFDTRSMPRRASGWVLEIPMGPQRATCG